jgi:hypothetical protein
MKFMHRYEYKRILAEGGLDHIWFGNQVEIMIQGLAKYW